jgi:alkylation response protein AidB-like acyl-CoA dehydrogenase
VYFGFTDEQVAFRDAVRDLLSDACPPSAVRAAWAGDGPGFDPKLWSRLGEMGVLTMLAPTEAGGLGLDEIAMALVLEETGRAAMPGPIVEHAAVAIPALSNSTLVDKSPRGGVSDDRVVTFADRSSRVGWAEASDAIVLVDGGQLRLLHPGDVAVLTPCQSVDRSRRDAAIEWTGGEVLTHADTALALDRAALGVAAQLCGLADQLIRMTVAYARDRRQFGVPIGSYQAIKHHLANALLRLEHARPAVYRAAYTVAGGLPTRARDVSMAKVMAGDAAAVAGRVALQCHGAIGYTWEHDLHLWLKRVWVLERAWGDAAFHRARVGDAVLGPA